MQPDETRERIVDHLRRYGAETSRVVDAFAARHHMHPTDLQALVLVLNGGRQGRPPTPGALRRELGLTSGAVTGAVDRLVAAGHVRREPDAADRRSVRLVWDDAGVQVGQEFFGPLGRDTDAVMDDFDDAELAVVERFLGRMAEAMADHRRRLAED